MSKWAARRAAARPAAKSKTAQYDEQNGFHTPFLRRPFFDMAFRDLLAKIGSDTSFHTSTSVPFALDNQAPLPAPWLPKQD